MLLCYNIVFVNSYCPFACPVIHQINSIYNIYFTNNNKVICIRISICKNICGTGFDNDCFEAILDSILSMEEYSCISFFMAARGDTLKINLCLITDYFITFSDKDFIFCLMFLSARYPKSSVLFPKSRKKCANFLATFRVHLPCVFLLDLVLIQFQISDWMLDRCQTQCQFSSTQ